MKWPAIILSTCAVAGLLWWLFTFRVATSVVVYVSHDQVFSEPILKDFERATKIKVNAVYDTEETKSAGVMNRLIAERDNPQADVYWANEPIRAEVLKQKGISAPYHSPSAEGIARAFVDPDGHWTGFSARARMLIVNRRMTMKPQSIMAYTDRRFAKQAVMANPLFGTTTTQVAALFALWGDARAENFMSATRANGVQIASSNGESADLVASGKFQFSMVDSDDVASRLKQGLDIEGVFPDQEAGGLGCFVVPNAVVLIKNAHNVANGKRLIDYLLSRDTEKKLAYSDAAQIPLHSGVDTPATVPRLETLKVMTVSYADVAAKLQLIQPFLKTWVGQ